MNTKSEIIVRFGPEADSPEIISNLVDLGKLHALTTEDLYIKWEQFSYQKHENRTDLSLKNLNQFKQFLQLQMEKKAAQASMDISNPSSITKKPKALKPLNSSPSLFGFNVSKGTLSKRRKLTTDSPDQKENSSSKLAFSSGHIDEHQNVDDELPHKSANTSLNTPPHSSSMTPTGLKKTNESGKILVSLNPENLGTAKGSDYGKKIKLTPFYDPQKYKFRTMRQNLLDAADVLDDQIEVFLKIVQDHYKLSAADFGDPTVQTQSEIHAVGRIVPDSPSSEEHLNMDSLAIETSRMAGIGRRVRLNLTGINEISLFCGQIVAVKGKNADGNCFTVSEILPLPYPDSPVSTADELEACRLAIESDYSKVVVTSGPYFSDESFDMSHLSSFIERLNTEIKPHALIMFGPFIDVTHPMISKGTIPHFPGLKSQPNTLDEIFTKIMAPVLKSINANIQVIMIPCTRDALSKHAAYPQDSLDRKSLQLPKNFKCFTNPATFQLNEVFFGCSNVDTFKDMKEITKGGNTCMRNRFDRVLEHILQQRRFYPVFPGGMKKRVLPSPDGEKKIYEHISGADLEVPYLGLTEFVGNFTPDIVIIPSEMHHFARLGKNVIMINPGRFIKPRASLGTYAEISISTPNLDDGKLTKIDGEEAVYLHNVWKRARVDVVSV